MTKLLDYFVSRMLRSATQPQHIRYRPRRAPALTEINRQQYNVCGLECGMILFGLGYDGSGADEVTHARTNARGGVINTMISTSRFHSGKQTLLTVLPETPV